MRRIVLCADDYALSPGVSRAIRELVSHGRLNAVSVMTVIPGFEQESAALASMSSPIPLAIGLHATLTGSFAPLVASPIATPDGKFPPLSKLLPPFGFLRIDRQAVKTEVAAQIAAFRKAFGRAPDFVDGHQHVQLLPIVGEALLAVMTEAAPRAWVRQCGRVAGPLQHLADPKGLLLDRLSRRFRACAEAFGVRTNPAFAGTYDFSARLPLPELFAQFLDGLPDGSVVMCHPGEVDDELRRLDPVTDQRAREYAYFAGDEFAALLRTQGVTLL